MSKHFFVARILSYVVFVALCLLASGQNHFANVVKPEYCYAGGMYIKKGRSVSAPIGQCHNFKCINPETNRVVSHTCADIKVEPGCEMRAKDFTRKYPLCCTHHVCDNGDSSSEEDD